ncbi:MAG: SPFH domain-containing protein [Planctomycetota bacterium]
MREKEVATAPGGVTLVADLLVLLASVGGVIGGIGTQNVPLGVSGAVLSVLCFFVLGGFFMVAPNEAAVLQLFGSYVGTTRTTGLRWANPFYSKTTVSLRVRNFETQHLKVNDIEGNPVEIAAVVVWKVLDTAQAKFHVDNYEQFVHVQSEAALRNLATRYPYDTHEDQKISLRGNTAVVADQLKKEIQEPLAQAGVEVVAARISHLAYSPEIAQAMLQRQQAGAIIAARTRIVEGAVSMVTLALEKLARDKVVALDEDRKAAMVSNLLVVLCGERSTQPVINAGTIYQ